MVTMVSVTIIGTIIAFYIGYEIGKGNSLVDLECPHELIEVSLKEQPVKCESKKIVNVKCPPLRLDQPYYLHKHLLGRSVFEFAYGNIRHPGNPVKSEVVYSQNPLWNIEQPFADCKDILLTRTGSRESMPNKCVAMIIVPEEQASPWSHSHRMGFSARLTNQYQNDYIRHINLDDEKELLLPFLQQREVLVKKLLEILGSPTRPDGSRRMATVMVANEGVMDLVLNFICSAKSSGISLDGIIVFVGHPAHLPLLTSMGVKGMYHAALGSMPARAAGNYADYTFTRLMWLKVTSVYLSVFAGFDVLFQDADLVWMRDPRPMLQATADDAVFMDDGARTPRFTPFFANTGFYFLRHNYRVLHMMERLARGVGEISFTHSHQATLNRHLTETQSLLNLKIQVLSSVDFPSGIMYHHNKSYMARLREHREFPYVFHMCWTDNRAQKVDYFKTIGMWFVPEDRPSCQDGRIMLASVLDPASVLPDEDKMLKEGHSSASFLSRWRTSDKKIEPKRKNQNSDLTEKYRNLSISDRCCKLPSHWATATGK